MKLATSKMISMIDKYSKEELGIPISELMDKSGEAVAKVIRERAPKNKPVVILAGKGNNGGDGYAAALKIMNDYDVTVYDILLHILSFGCVVLGAKALDYGKLLPSCEILHVLFGGVEQGTY